jgi:RHS repeat-associated protein
MPLTGARGIWWRLYRREGSGGRNEVAEEILASYAYGDPANGLGGRIGNMTAKMEGGVTHNFTYNLEHIHAVASDNGSALSYDRNGNTFDAASLDSYLFDVENRLSQNNAWLGTPVSTFYTYDGSGEMVRRNVTRAAWPGQYDEKDVFIDGIFEEHSQNCGAAVSTTKYYMALGRVIAARKSNESPTLRFYLADHLGSTAATVSGTNGEVLSQTKYWPFGAVRSGWLAESRGYTGQQQEPSNTSGLYYYHARFYSTTLAHFVSADPTATGEALALNRYAYARQNPNAYTDPSGLTPLCDGCPDDEIHEISAGCSTGPSDCSLSNPWVYSTHYLAQLTNEALFWGYVFAVSPDLLLAILIHEMDQSALKDIVETIFYAHFVADEAGAEALQDSLAGTRAEINWGPANISLSVAKEMEALYGEKIGDPTRAIATIDRLLNPETAIMYMAAYLHHLDQTVLAETGNQGKLEHQAAVYNVDLGEYRISQDRHAGVLGPSATTYWNNVSKYLDQAKALNMYCGGGGFGCHERVSVGPYGPYR